MSGRTGLRVDGGLMLCNVCWMADDWGLTVCCEFVVSDARLESPDRKLDEGQRWTGGVSGSNVGCQDTKNTWAVEAPAAFLPFRIHSPSL
jgi:hypothetical protein